MSVTHPVVGCERCIDEGPRHHRAALDPGTGGDFAEAYDGHLRRIDDAVKRLDAAFAQT